MLYFQVRRKCGYNLQLVINLKEKIIKRGYCLVAWADLVTLNSKKELNKLCDQFKAEGFAIINDSRRFIKMANNNKLTKQFTINTDEETARQIELIADLYQRKPAELLRLLLGPALRNEWAKIQRQEHPENQAAPVVAIFHN